MVNINCYGESLDATKKLISYFMSAGLQEKWNRGTQTISVLKSIEQLSTVKNDQIFTGQFDQAGICRGKPPEDILRFIRDAIMINTENVLNGNITAEEAIIKMQEDALSLKSGKTGVSETTSTTAKQTEKSNVQSTGETLSNTTETVLETSQNTAVDTTSQ
jgi:hypothetical protein